MKKRFMYFVVFVWIFSLIGRGRDVSEVKVTEWKGANSCGYKF